MYVFRSEVSSPICYQESMKKLSFFEVIVTLNHFYFLKGLYFEVNNVRQLSGYANQAYAKETVAFHTIVGNLFTFL